MQPGRQSLQTFSKCGRVQAMENTLLAQHRAVLTPTTQCVHLRDLLFAVYCGNIKVIPSIASEHFNLFFLNILAQLPRQQISGLLVAGAKRHCTDELKEAALLSTCHVTKVLVPRLQLSSAAARQV